MKIANLIVAISAITSTMALSQSVYRSCVDDAALQAERSIELQKIRDADQAERQGQGLTPETAFRDRDRRKRIGEIFGEGCFKTARDYANAALVFQHGDRPDHFWQTFTWARRAVEEGDQNQKRMMALGLDRYLVNTGKKQLFASQAQKPKGEECFCLAQVESTFPESKRTEYMGSTLSQQLAWVDDLNKNQKCPPAKFCAQPLENSPQGSVPGFW